MNLKGYMLLSLFLLFVLSYFVSRPYGDLAGVTKENEFKGSTVKDNIYLSRDLGHYMNRLLDTHKILLEDNEEEFDQQVEYLKRSFIVKKGNSLFIRWTIKEDTSANDLADDLRIIHALHKASDQFERPDYKELADNLASTITKTQLNRGIYTDYTDWAFNKPVKRLTLSALTPELFTLLKQTGQTKKLLMNTKENGVFFPEFYDIESQQYKWSYDVYMEEQLQVAINRQRIGQPSPFFQSWVLNEWKKRKRIPIQYISTNQLPAVKEESLDVYLYLKDYFQLIGNSRDANEVEAYIEELVDEKKIAPVRFFEWQLYEIMKRKS